jgi:hypothetical protein
LRQTKHQGFVDLNSFEQRTSDFCRDFESEEREREREREGTFERSMGFLDSLRQTKHGDPVGSFGLI